LIVVNPAPVRFKRHFEHALDPLGELGVQSVVDPLSLAAILQQPAGPKLGQMPRHLRLVVIERPDELAHAELAFGEQHQHDPGACFIAEALEDSGRGEGHGRPLYVFICIFGFTHIFLVVGKTPVGIPFQSLGSSAENL
jgi:hypothetical protein